MSDDSPNLVLEQLRLARRVLADIRTVTLQGVDCMKRIERRMGQVERRIEDQRDDLELMLKTELMGRFAHFENQVEARLDEMADHVHALGAKLGGGSPPG